MMKFAPLQRSVLTKTLWLFQRELVTVGILSLMVNLLMLTPTLYMIQVYDRVLQSRSELTLLAVSILTVFLLFLMAFFEWLRTRVLIHGGLRLDDGLSSHVFNASFKADLNNESRASSAFSDLIQIRQFLTGIGIIAFFDAPWSPIYMLILFRLHPWLGFLGIFAAITQLFLATHGHRPSLEPFEAAQDAKTEANMFLQSKLLNADVIESMGMGDNLKSRWKDKNTRHVSLGFKSQSIINKLQSWSKFIRYCQQSAALGCGALLVIDGQLSPGAMIAANVLMTRALTPIDSLVGGWRQFAGMKKAFVRLDELLSKYPIQSRSQMNIGRGVQVSLRNVFAFATARTAPILKDLTFEIPSESVTLILGPSGSGKSTLAKVILGIWPSVDGTVLLNDHQIIDLERKELGRHIGYLSQDIQLLDGTIAENISRFGPLSTEKVIEASKNADLHEVILRFPHGYDTQVGEVQGGLTGGQRQRIGLARAIYDYPALVVLDEPNSNLDDEGNASLYKAIEILKTNGSTVFLITHRPIGLSVVDQILMLDSGAVRVLGSTDTVVNFLKEQQSNTLSGKP